MNEVVRLEPDRGQQAPARINCLSFKPHRTGSLVGFADMHVPRWHVKLFGLTVHQANGRRWANPPGRPQIDRDGNVQRDDAGRPKYSVVLEFDDSEIGKLFSQVAVAAVLAYAPDAFDGGEP